MMALIQARYGEYIIFILSGNAIFVLFIIRTNLKSLSEEGYDDGPDPSQLGKNTHLFYF